MVAESWDEDPEDLDIVNGVVVSYRSEQEVPLVLDWGDHAIYGRVENEHGDPRQCSNTRASARFRHQNRPCVNGLPPLARFPEKARTFGAEPVCR